MSAKTWNEPPKVPPAGNNEHFQNDTGYSDAIVRHFGGSIRFCPDEACWLAFNEREGWKRDETGIVRELVTQFARTKLDEAHFDAIGQDPEVGKRRVSSAASLGNLRRISSAIQLASSNQSVVVRADELDSERDLVGCGNGVVDLRDGRFYPHRLGKLVTRRLATDFVSAAPAPTWTAFLERVQPDPEMRGFLQRLAGYCLHGAVREHVLPFHYGTGANGKGTFLEHGLLKLAGSYGAKLTDSLVYAADRNNAPHLEIAGLCGKRLALGEENREGGRLNEAILKAITGGDRVKGRFHHANFLEYWPTYKIQLVGNHKPRIAGTDEGIWRRFLLVDWPVQIPENERDHALQVKLSAEMPGILNWAIQGALDWQRDGLRPPPSCTESTKEFRRSSDVLADFIAECFNEREDGKVTKAKAYQLYEEWAQNSGIKHLMTKRSLGNALAERGWSEVRLSHGNQSAWVGWAEKPDID